MRTPPLALLPMLGLLTGCIADGLTMPANRGLARDSLRAHRLDLGPEDVEIVEVLNGPPAARLYGTHRCAAILVTTKHPRTR